MQIVAVWILWTFVSTIVTWGYDDLSSSKPTNQYRSSGSCSHCYADYAVDRIISTCMRTDDIGFTSSDSITWWYVDLGGLKSVYNIRIQFKDYGDEYTKRQKGRFAGFSLYVSNTTERHDGYLCYKDGPELPPLDFNTSCITHGHYVIFYNERLFWRQYPIGYLTTGVITELCEVTVTGCSRGVYGESCNKTCPDNCIEHKCDIISGTCLECLPGWVGDFCDKDLLSANKPASQYKTATNCYSCDANNAVDGNISTCMRTEDIASTSQMKTTWWSVDLGDIHRIYNIRLQFKGYGDSFCCENEMHGINCKYHCSGHCLNNGTCNFITGFCNNGCSVGYLGDMCNETCNVGYFGMHCTQSCSPNCLYGVCRHYDGACTCKPGWCGSPY